MANELAPKPISRGDILVFARSTLSSDPFPMILCNKPAPPDDIRTGIRGIMIVPWGTKDTCFYPAFEYREYNSDFRLPKKQIVVKISQRPGHKATSEHLMPYGFCWDDV